MKQKTITGFLLALVLLLNTCGGAISETSAIATTSMALLSIHSDSANCFAMMTSESNEPTIAITMHLKQKKDGVWTTVATWPKSGAASTTAIYCSTSDIESGYTYRLDATGKIYDASGELLATLTVSSKTICY